MRLFLGKHITSRVKAGHIFKIYFTCLCIIGGLSETLFGESECNRLLCNTSLCIESLGEGGPGVLIIKQRFSLAHTKIKTEL